MEDAIFNCSPPYLWFLEERCASLNTLQQYVPFNSVYAVETGCAEVPVWWLGGGMTMLIVVLFPHSPSTHCFTASTQHQDLSSSGCDTKLCALTASPKTHLLVLALGQQQDEKGSGYAEH